MSNYSGDHDDANSNGKGNNFGDNFGDRKKKRIEEVAKKLSMQGVGNLDAVDSYLAQAEGMVAWDDLLTFMTNDGWVRAGEWPYHTPDKSVLYEAHRFNYAMMPAKKKFIIRRSVYGRWIVNAGPVRVPYNLPDIISRKGEPLHIVEGEKGADECKAKGLRVTCVQGQNWTEEVADFFVGEDVVLCLDDDDAGRTNTERALKWLTKVGATVRVPLLPGIGRKQGLDDWLRTHTVDEYLHIVARTKPEQGGAKPTVIDPTQWEGKAVPDRIFVVDPLVPANNVALLYGDGGLGKSLIALMLSAARALRQPWLGLKTLPGRTMVVSAEDDADELHRRLDMIARHYGASFKDLGAIRLIDLVGQDAVIGELARSGRIVATELYQFLVREVANFNPGLVIVDALADSFSGDENNRTQARQFVSMLRGVGMNYDCGFVTLAHPSLSGMITGRGTSGTTGWSNSVRSRMYFETVEVDSKEPDPNLKVLRQPKANYSAPGFEMLVRYQNGVYVPVEGVQLDRVEKMAMHESVFLAILKRLSEQDRHVGDSAGTNYAPSVFANEEEARDKMVTKAQLKDAMLRLFRKKIIKVDIVGPASKQRRRIVEDVIPF